MQLSLTVHGLTRSREIVDLLWNLSLGVSYQDVLNLYASWAHYDIGDNAVCPYELALGYPATAILDNDDFCVDTLTGVNTSHRTNVMFVQPNIIAGNDSNKHCDKLPPKCKPQDLKNISLNAHKVQPYKTFKCGQPAVRPAIDIIADTAQLAVQRQTAYIHSLARLDDLGKFVSPQTKTVGAFTGFQANVHSPVTKSKAYYYLAFPKPPQKAVVHEVMCCVVQAAHQNVMPFIQLIGDQPVYALIVDIKNEHPEQFKLILPFLGTFHTQMSFMSAINKQFKGSGLAELLVAADVIAEGSVEQALKGKHYKRGICCLKLVYGLLTRKSIQNGFENGLSISPDLQAKLQVLRTPGEHTKDELCDAYRSLQANPEISRFVEAAFAMVEQTGISMTTY